MTSLDTLPETAARAPLTLRAVLFQIHLYAGLVLCAALILLGLTGSLLVYHEELEAWLAPPPRAQTAGAPQAPGAIAGVAMAVRPGFVATQIMLPEAAGAPALVRLARALREGEQQGGGHAGQGPQIFIDPVSLQLLETRDGPAVPILRFAHDLHGNLLMGQDGRRIVGWLGLAMLLLGLSGIVLWWPKPGRWCQAFTIRRKARGYTLMRDLHGAAGIWGLVVFLIVSLSGVAIAFPQTAGAVMGSKSPVPPRGGGAVAVSPAQFDAVALLATAAVPGAHLMAVNAPRRKGQPFRITLTGAGSVEGAPAITVSADPQKGVTEIRDPALLATGDRLLVWQRPLHEGQGLGPLWRAAVFVMGFLPLLFAVTGVWMWLVKRRNGAS